MTRPRSPSPGAHQARQAALGLLTQSITVTSCFSQPSGLRTPDRAFLRTAASCPWTHSWSRQVPGNRAAGAARNGPGAPQAG